MTTQRNARFILTGAFVLVASIASVVWTALNGAAQGYFILGATAVIVCVSITALSANLLASPLINADRPSNLKTLLYGIAIPFLTIILLYILSVLFLFSVDRFEIPIFHKISGVAIITFISMAPFGIGATFYSRERINDLYKKS